MIEVPCKKVVDVDGNKTKYYEKKTVERRVLNKGDDHVEINDADFETG